MFASKSYKNLWGLRKRPALTLDIETIEECNVGTKGRKVVHFGEEVGRVLRASNPDHLKELAIA